jgi:hypothetical protein
MVRSGNTCADLAGGIVLICLREQALSKELIRSGGKLSAIHPRGMPGGDVAKRHRQPDAGAGTSIDPLITK